MRRHGRRQRMPRGPPGRLDLCPVRTRRAMPARGSRRRTSLTDRAVRYRRFRNGARSRGIARGDPRSEVFGGRALWLPQALPEGWRIRDGDRRYRAIPGAGTFAPSSVPRAESPIVVNDARVLCKHALASVDGFAIDEAAVGRLLDEHGVVDGVARRHQSVVLRRALTEVMV